MTRAFLGLGSNVGDRLANLRAAAERLGAHRGIEVTGVSSVYETEAMDGAVGQRDFYNAAIEIRTDLAPRELLSACKEVERALGRAPGGRRHAPRPIDVDLLLVEGVRTDEDDLALPHPALASRRFVLVPLLELDPSLPFRDALAALGDDQRVTPVGALAE